MRAILTGGGKGDQAAELDKVFASLLDAKKPLLYIPIAMDEKRKPYPDCLAFITSTFEPLGISRFSMWTEKEFAGSTLPAVSAFSGIYIGGGNAFYLAKKLREYDLLPFLRRALKEDIPIYGGSAGAILFGASIKTALPYDENRVGLEKFEGLNILNGYSLVCHFDDTQKATVKALSTEHPELKLLMLTERNGLYVLDTSTQVIGDDPAYLLEGDAFTELPSHSLINL